MVYGVQPTPSEPLIDRNCAKDGTTPSLVCNRRIAHTITTTVANNWYTTLCTFDIHSEKCDAVIKPYNVYHCILDTTKKSDDVVAIVYLDIKRITRSRMQQNTNPLKLYSSIPSPTTPSLKK